MDRHPNHFWRLFAYLLIPVAIAGACIGVIAGVLAALRGDHKAAASLFLFVAFWIWAAISAYNHEIRIPREAKRLCCLQVREDISNLVECDSPISDAIGRIMERYPDIDVPRYRYIKRLNSDTTIELETNRFTIRLYGKAGALKSWEVS